jgi:predicted small secreted protein
MRKFVLTAACAAALAGCGGGGDGAGSDVSVGPYQIKTAVRNLVTTANSWATISGRGSDGNTYALTLSSAPLSDGVFAVTGATTARYAQTSTVRINAGTPSTTTSTGYYNASDVTPVGSSSSDGTCSLVTASTVLPDLANLGASGAFGNSSKLAACSSSATVTATSTTTWSMESESGVALLCSNTQYLTGASLGIESDCYEITTSGALGTRARVSITVTSPASFTLVARNY